MLLSLSIVFLRHYCVGVSLTRACMDAVVSQVFVKYADKASKLIDVRAVEKIMSELLQETLNDDLLDLVIQMTDCMIGLSV